MAFSWNCQGLGNALPVEAFENILTVYSPNIVFLSETKMNSKQMGTVKCKRGFQCDVFVGRVGPSGGLELLWYDSKQVTLCSYSENHIDVIVEANGDKPTYRLTRFYGESSIARRSQTWELLR